MRFCAPLLRGIARSRLPVRNSIRNIRAQHNAPRQRAVKEAAEHEPIDVPAPIWYKRIVPVNGFFSWFHRMQSTRPYTVQLTTSTLVYIAGDLLAQDIGGEPYDLNRTLRMIALGSVISIPGYKWFLFLGNHFNYASLWGSIFVKVCVQQAVFTPVYNAYFFGMQAILSGEPPSAILARIRYAVPTSTINSLKLWPVATAITYRFIAPEYRFMFSGLFAVAWQGYLSYLNKTAEEKVDGQKIGGRVPAGAPL